MKRSPALMAFSREHHTALVWAKRAQREGFIASETLMTQLVAVFDGELEPHFVAEETNLLPFLQQHGQHDLVARTLTEHRILRDEIERIRGGHVEAVASFGKALETHVRFEERLLFVAAETLAFPGTVAGKEKRNQQSHDDCFQCRSKELQP